MAGCKLLNGLHTGSVSTMIGLSTCLQFAHMLTHHVITRQKGSAYKDRELDHKLVCVCTAHLYMCCYHVLKTNGGPVATGAANSRVAQARAV